MESWTSVFPGLTTGELQALVERLVFQPTPLRIDRGIPDHVDPGPTSVQLGILDANHRTGERGAQPDPPRSGGTITGSAGARV